MLFFTQNKDTKHHLKMTKDTLSCLSSSGDKKALYDFAEILADISGNLTVANYIDRVKIENSRNVVSLAIDWAIEFTRLHAATDWNEVEYIETVDNFTEEKIKALIAGDCDGISDDNWACGTLDPET